MTCAKVLTVSAGWSAPSWAAPLQVGEVFIFLNKSGTRIKLLHWEHGGFVLYYKRLESGTFRRPTKDGDLISAVKPHESKTS